MTRVAKALHESGALTGGENVVGRRNVSKHVRAALITASNYVSIFSNAVLF
jgi:hypothetical protein